MIDIFSRQFKKFLFVANEGNNDDYVFIGIRDFLFKKYFFRIKDTLRSFLKASIYLVIILGFDIQNEFHSVICR